MTPFDIELESTQPKFIKNLKMVAEG